MKKKLFLLLITFCSVNLYACPILGAKFKNQLDTIRQKAVKEEISRALLFNMKEGMVKDSVALYTFAIKVMGYKNKKGFHILEIKCKEPLCNIIFPKIDSLLKKIEFGVFVRSRGLTQIIIPMAIVVTSHDKLPKDNNINIWDLPKRIEGLFESDNVLKYQTVYINPLTIMLDKQVYH